MSERKTSQARLNINREYHNKMEEIKIRVPKGYREIISNYCENTYGTSVNQVVINLLNEDMKAHNVELHVPSGRREIKTTENAET